MSAASRWPSRRSVFLTILLLVMSGLVWSALAIPLALRQPTAPLAVGDVAPQEVLAPHTLTYQSETLTEEQRVLAEQNILPVYTPADPNVARKQLGDLRAALSFISSVRADSYATSDQKLRDLAALEDIRLTREEALSLLELSDARWQSIQQEAILVLEQIMRNTIRAEQVVEKQRNILALVNIEFPPDQAALVANLVTTLIAPNSVYDQAQTDLLRQAARQAVKPQQRTLIAGEVIVQRGQIVSALDIEALAAFDLLDQQQDRWQNWVSTILLTIVIMSFLVVYLRRSPALVVHLRALLLAAALFLAFLYGGRLILPGRTVLPYVYPLMGFGLTMTALFNAECALVATLPLAVLISFGLPNAFDLTLFYVISSFFGVFVLRRAQRITSFLTAGAAIALSGSMVVVAYRLADGLDLPGLATLAAAALMNGVASASISVLAQYFLAQFLGMTTALQLIELSRPDHPLLQFILRNAPGTYQHSLQVASLAEQAAERIGADALLTRVGALYHDAGKAVNPGFFIENQIAGELNPHTDLTPTVSATTILRHVHDGLDLGRKYRLPHPILAFMEEHHGTMITRYQYVEAIKAAGGDERRVNADAFRYPGPRPRSKETALLMLADGCEARVRAERPRGETELRSLIRSVIDERLAGGELHETTLTLKDLDEIVDSFTATLKGIYHPRIQYPNIPSTQPAAASEPAPVLSPDLSLDLSPESSSETSPKPEPVPVVDNPPTDPPPQRRSRFGRKS